MSPQSPALKVLHILSGDLWAGAEVQAYTLLSTLQNNPDIVVAVALMNDGELAKRLRARKIAVHIFDEGKLSGLQILIALRKLMRSWQPHIVHTHRMKENVLGAIANRLATNVPSVRTVHGAPEHAKTGLRHLHKTLFRWLDHWCGLHLQQCIIAVSHDLGEKLAREFPREKIAVIENGVDIEAMQAQVHPVEFRNGQPQATHIGIVGRLQPVKRVDIFLEMAALLKTQQPERDWQFHIFGDGPLRDQLIAQAKKLGIANIAHFHGHRHDIIACIAALDVLVMCSDHEGLPMTILEALAVGTPIVAHAVGGITAIIQNRCGGIEVYQHDAAHYAKNLRQLLDNDTTALIHAGLTRIQEYSATNTSNRTYQQYLTLTKRHQTAF